MNHEKGKSLKQILASLGSKVSYLMHGRSAKEDNRIKKIANTGIVSQQDRDSYRGEMLAEASSLGGTSAVVLMDRKLKSLPQDMLDQRVLENAQYKAKEYKLIPNV